jgi:multidrug efflux pump subunit AcrA (membrane-fusion protein)
MNAAVDIVGGRAENAILIPVEALRELGPGEFAVFVLQDGEPRLRPVEVGIMDFTFAEILSGLEAGETVTTGIVETG